MADDDAGPPRAPRDTGSVSPSSSPTSTSLAARAPSVTSSSPGNAAVNAPDDRRQRHDGLRDRRRGHVLAEAPRRCPTMPVAVDRDRVPSTAASPSTSGSRSCTSPTWSAGPRDRGGSGSSGWPWRSTRTGPRSTDCLVARCRVAGSSASPTSRCSAGRTGTWPGLDVRVLPEHRRRGVGTALVESAERMARAAGRTELGGMDETPIRDGLRRSRPVRSRATSGSRSRCAWCADG